MPQMSPLMWGNLFILFSLLLIFSAVKVYFSNTKNMSKMDQISINNDTQQNDFNWTW